MAPGAGPGMFDGDVQQRGTRRIAAGEAPSTSPPLLTGEETAEEAAAILGRAACGSDQKLLVVTTAGRVVLSLAVGELVDRMGQSPRAVGHAHRALLASPRERAGARLPWLLVGLVGSMVTAAVMSHYARVLAADIAVAFFVPGLGYLIDAVGTQTEAVVVRGLAINDITFRRVLWDELRTGCMLGAGLGALVLGGIWWRLGNPHLAIAVAVTVFTGATLATLIALSLPWAIKRLGGDPAFGSGPIATIVTYVVTLLVYFAAIKVLR
jgi:magnesium transporter